MTTTLMKAALQGDYKKMQELLSPMNVRATDNKGYTVLNYAILKPDNIKCVKKLLTYRGIVNLKNIKEETPLIMAVKLKRHKYIELFTGLYHVEINEQDYNGNTALMYACYNNDAHTINQLYFNGARIIRNTKGITPFEYIQKNKSLATKLTNKYYCDILKDYLEESKINSYLTPNYDNALITSCKYEQLDWVKHWIKNGADINYLNINKYSPLYWAIVRKNNEILLYILDQDVSIECNHIVKWKSYLHLSIKTNNLMALHCLLKKKIDINIHNNINDVTPLNYASTLGKKYIVDKLIDCKADLNIPNIYSNTPLINAINNNYESIALKLIDAKCDVNASSKKKTYPFYRYHRYTNTTALLRAISLDNTNIVKKLIQANANVNHKTSKGRSSLLLGGI